MQKSIFFNDREAARQIQAGGINNSIAISPHLCIFILFSLIFLTKQENFLAVSSFYFFYSSIYFCDRINKKIDDKNLFYRYLYMCFMPAFYSIIMCIIFMILGVFLKEIYEKQFYHAYYDIVSLLILFLFCRRSISTFEYFRSLHDSSVKA